MPNYALIKNSKVINIIVADNDESFLEHLKTFHNCDEIVESSENCEIDGTYVDGVFYRKPVEEVPPLAVVEE